MSLGAILVIILIQVLLGAIRPARTQAHGVGLSGLVGVILIIVLILALLDRI